MNVLALDLSLTATGTMHLGAGRALWRAPKPSPADLDYKSARLWWYRRQLEDLIENYTVDLVVIEDLPRINNVAAAPLGMLHGVVRTVLFGADIAMAFVSPTSLKKYATSKGNATKPDMRMELYKRADIEERDDNLVDAMWLWYMALDHYGEPELMLPIGHRMALEAVDWPEVVP